jgi:hypothetical protein
MATTVANSPAMAKLVIPVHIDVLTLQAAWSGRITVNSGDASTIDRTMITVMARVNRGSSSSIL